MNVAIVVMSIGLAVLFAGVGLAKVSRTPWAVTQARDLGYSVRAYQGIGLLEVAGAVGLVIGLWWWPLRLATLACLAALLVGAAWSLRRAGESAKEFGPVLWVGTTTVAAAALTVVTV